VFGDVFGHGGGSFAEYVSVPESALVLKPSNVSFEEAAAVSLAAVTALQGLRVKAYSTWAKSSDQWSIWWRGNVCGANCQIIRSGSHGCMQHKESGDGAFDWRRPCYRLYKRGFTQTGSDMT